MRLTSVLALLLIFPTAPLQSMNVLPAIAEEEESAQENSAASIVLTQTPPTPPTPCWQEQKCAQKKPEKTCSKPLACFAAGSIVFISVLFFLTATQVCKSSSEKEPCIALHITGNGIESELPFVCESSKDVLAAAMLKSRIAIRSTASVCRTTDCAQSAFCGNIPNLNSCITLPRCTNNVTAVIEAAQAYDHSAHALKRRLKQKTKYQKEQLNKTKNGGNSKNNKSHKNRPHKGR